MVSFGFWCFSALNPAQSQLHGGTKPHQKDTEKGSEWSRKALGDFGELESLKSCKFRSDVIKAQQQPTVLESLGGFTGSSSASHQVPPSEKPGQLLGASAAPNAWSHLPDPFRNRLLSREEHFGGSDVTKGYVQHPAPTQLLEKCFHWFPFPAQVQSTDWAATGVGGTS